MAAAVASGEPSAHPAAHTFKGLMLGLGILSPHLDEDESGVSAEHDILYVHVDVDDLPEDSDDGKKLLALGWHVSDADNWGYFT